MGKLGQLLVARGWITVQQLTRALQNQNAVGGRLGTNLLEMDVLGEDLLARSLAEQQGVPAAGIEELRAVPDEVLHLIPEKLARRCRAVPFRVAGGRLDVAMQDPRNLVCQDEIAFACGRRVKVHVLHELRILEAMQRYYHEEVPSRFSLLLDRLNRARYLWGGAGAARLGEQETAPERSEVLTTLSADDLLTGAPRFAPPPLPEPALPPIPRRRSLFRSRSGQQEAHPPAAAPAGEVLPPLEELDLRARPKRQRTDALAYMPPAAPVAPTAPTAPTAAPEEGAATAPPLAAAASAAAPADESAARTAYAARADELLAKTGPMETFAAAAAASDLDETAAEGGHREEVAAGARRQGGAAAAPASEAAPAGDTLTTTAAAADVDAEQIEAARILERIEPAASLLPAAAAASTAAAAGAAGASASAAAHRTPDLETTIVLGPRPSVPRQRTAAAEKIELSAEERNELGLDAPPRQERSPANLAEVEAAFGATGDREEIGRILLAFLAAKFRRVALFQANRKRVTAWMAQGEGIDQEAFSRYSVGFNEPSVFLNLERGSSIHFGPMPPMQAHRQLALCWGGGLPRDCLVLPILIKERMVVVVYVDGSRSGSAGIDLPELQRLRAAAASAFEHCILRKKHGYAQS